MALLSLARASISNKFTTLTGGTSLQKGTSWLTSALLLYIQKECHQCTGPSHPVPSSPVSQEHAELSG